MRQNLQGPHKASAILLTLCLVAADIGTTLGVQSSEEMLEHIYLEAHQAFQQGKFELAKKKLEVLLGRQADIPEALNLLGAVYDKTGKPNDAERCFQRAIALKPDYVEARKNLSLHWVKQNKIDGAITELTTALKWQPSDPEIHAALGRLYFLNKDFKKALYHLSESSKDTRLQTGEMLSMLAVAELRTGEPSRAQQYVAEARRRGIVDAQVYMELGEAYEKRGNFEKAKSSYEMALKIKPEMDLGQALLARCYQQEGQLESAVEHYTKAFELKPTSHDYAFALASTYFQAERYEDTIRVLEPWAASEKSADDFNLLGSSYAKLGKGAEAGAAFEKAITLKPQNIEAYYNLGLLLLQARSYDQAVRAFEQALDLFPHSEKLLTALGFSHQIKGDFRSAQSVFKRMAERFPMESAPYFYLGSSFLEAGQEKEALWAFTEAKERNPKDHRILYLMGLIYYNQGQFPKAFDLLQTSIQLDPNFVFSYQQLAKISLKKGDLDSAVKYALKAIEVDSTLSQPHYLLGQVYMRLQKTEEANRELEQFEKLQANSAAREYRVFTVPSK